MLKCYSSVFFFAKTVKLTLTRSDVAMTVLFDFKFGVPNVDVVKRCGKSRVKECNVL